MATEIERKFLVNRHLLPKLGVGNHIQQGYLSREPAVRVRLENPVLPNGPREPTHGLITVKGPGLLSRAEYEYVIPVRDAKEMLMLCKHRVSKVRYEIYVGPHVEDGGWMYEVDMFLGANQGLCIAEIELSSEDEEFLKPDWLGMEVTNDPAYSNVNLKSDV